VPAAAAFSITGPVDTGLISGLEPDMAPDTANDPDQALIETERLRFVFQQLPLTLLVTLLNAGLTAFVLAPFTGHAALSSWLGLVGGLAVTRMVLGRIFFRRRREGAGASVWAAVSVIGAAASGGLWGGGLAVMFPGNETTQLFLAFVVGGMCAGAATVNFSHLPTAAAFILPASLPLAVSLLLHGTGPRYISALMVVIFAVSLCVGCLRAHCSFGDRLRLQFALRRQRRELSDANEKLQLEVAERKTIQETLHQAQKMEAIGHLTGGIAHDFNNLLQVVVGNLNLIRRASAGNARVVDYALAAEQAAKRGADLTGSLLAYARRQALRTERVDVNMLLTEFEPLLLRTLGGTIVFRMTLQSSVPSCQADPTHFQSAILNLTINARDAMPHGGTLSVSSGVETLAAADLAGNPDASPGRFVCVSVQDTGHGMTPDILARVFEPFFTTKPIGRGSGLGLSQVYGFARQSGGHVRLASTPGTGTRATISLPVLQAAQDGGCPPVVHEAAAGVGPPASG
jgi:signal transduction histidine kinase